ncbi:MAG TPA: hypothetical protein VIA18_04015, partial [Polyangia bacterium]|nr:hypothetical protein [Polyangia bacterium]
YTYSFVANHSGGTLNGTSGAYVAGATGSVSDVVQVADAAGHTASATINIGSAINVLPANASVTPRASIMFMASGGSGVGYTWTFTSNASGGTLSTAGLYFAGDKGSVSDVVHVVDSLGNTAQATVNVGPSLGVSPPSASVYAGTTIDFSATGGSDTGYQWTLPTNGSGATIGATSGVYIAGSKSGSDVVKVTDSLGGSITATVTVSARPQPVIAPATASVPPRGSVTFTATGGAGGFKYSVVSPSGGTIGATSGVYVAGAVGSVTDVVTVTDVAGATASASVLVGPAITLSPPSATVYPHGSLTITPSGGAGGYKCALTTNMSGGTIDANSCIYTAGATGKVTDVVVVTDSLSNIASLAINVSAALAITPATTSTYPHGTVGFGASGGSKANYVFSFMTNASGGTIGAASGVYTAGGNSGTDVIKLTDSINDVVTATVSVSGGIVIVPSPASTAPRGQVMFMASGGSNASFSWTMSASPSGGGIDATTGIYTAGAIPNVTDIVHVVDSVGNVANVNVMVGAGVTISPPSQTVPPRGTIGFFAQGGSNKGFVWAPISLASGGTIDPSSGAYKAGTSCNTNDSISVHDSLGNTATASVTVGACLVIAPTTANAPPHGTVIFTSSGGSATNLQWTINPNKSGAIISTSGVYVAGATPNVVDTVVVTDSLGNAATANVNVGTGLVVMPATASTGPRGPIAFTVSGGSNAGLTWTLAPGGSGGTLDNLGNYKAGTTPNVTDTITVSDNLGNSATATVKVGAALALAPLTPTVAPRATQQFTATGGSNGSYTWEVTVTTSGSTVSGGGLYTAGTTPGGQDTVCVNDSFGNQACTIVTIGAGVTVAPPTANAAPKGAVAFSATGGSGTGFTFSISGNNSGGSITTKGACTAGATENVTDTITATDSLGNTGTATVQVGAGVTIKPKKATVSPGGLVAFSATGGSGSISFAVTTNSSGASINATTGAYVAGPTGSTIDTVTATDKLGNTATAKVTVGAALAVAPASAQTVAPRASIPFVASGGTAPYKWQLTTNGSSGNVSGSGVYTAGVIGSTNDVLTVTDAFGSVATVAITVTAGVTVTPPTASIAPGGAQAFAAAGGSNIGFTWAFQTNASGASIDGNGHYVAGHGGSVSDVIIATDSLGNFGTATVNVGAALGITPGAQTVPPESLIDFVAAGGSNTGFAWTLAGTSGGSLDPVTGIYKAGPNGPSSDTITVTDSFGNVASVVITIGSGISITPAPNGTTPPLGSLSFVATGGSGTGYQWSMSASPSGGGIDPTTGIYKAGPVGNVIDIVHVADSLGNVASVNVAIGPALAITPPTDTTPPMSAIGFAVSGGSGSGYAWSFAPNGNGSKGKINSGTGDYVAGSVGDSTDVIVVSDSLGNTASATIHVTTGVHVTPPTAGTPPRGKLTFAATGGSGTGYQFTLAASSGGSIDSASGVYVAGN